MYLRQRPRQWTRAHFLVATAIACTALIGCSAVTDGAIKSSVNSTSALTSAGPLRIGMAYGDPLTWLSDQELAATLTDTVALGAKWIRVDLSWDDIQPDSANAYKWERFDRVANAAHKRGLTLLPIVAYTPPWARPAGCFTDKCAPANADQFATFAGEAASRYQSITTWEIWNEENSQRFWQPQPDPAAYANVLALTTASVRKSNPAAKIFIGGLSVPPP